MTSSATQVIEKIYKYNKKPNWPTHDLPRALKFSEQKYHGWFSKEQQICLKEDYRGRPFSNIWLNEAGKEVMTTTISTTALPGSNFQDIEYIGVCVKWVRSIK